MAEQHLAVLFADICDSSAVFEREGDIAGNRSLRECLRLLEETVQAQGGAVARALGEGLLAVFPSAEAAFAALVGMRAAGCRPGLVIKAGLHWGPARLIGGEAFGPAVREAALLAALARTGEMLVGEAAAGLLPAAWRWRLQPYEAPAAGAPPSRLFRLAEAAIPTGPALVLGFQGAELRYAGGAEPLVIGRDAGCGMVVSLPYASRRHAQVSLSDERFILTDQSSNGTFVLDEARNRLFLRNQATPLSGSGLIALGQEPEALGERVIRYRLEAPA